MSAQTVEAPKAIKPAPVESKVDPEGRLVKVHKEITSGVEEITPEFATAVLEKQTDNRPVSQRRVDDYVRQIQTGRWMVNGESIVFDWFDRLIDGQHRLWAVVQADKKVRSVVTRGIDPAAFVTIDTGKTRDAKDLLSIRGEVNSVCLASVLRLLWRMELFEAYRPVLDARRSVRKTGDEAVSPIGRRWTTAMTPSPREIEEVLTRHPDSRKWVRKASSQRVIPPGPLGFTCYWLSMIGVKESEIDAFIFCVAEGANMETNDPLYRVHKRFRDIKMSRGTRSVDTIEAVALLVKAWNHARAGTKIDLISWKESEDMPEPQK